MPTDLYRAEYRDFVRSRFKPFPFPYSLLHATVGMLGELTELRAARSRENLCEELGDFRFYFAAFQQIDWPEASQAEFIATRILTYEYPYPPQSLEEVLGCLTENAGALLDCAKKLWAYEAPFDAKLLDQLAWSTAEIARALDNLHALLHYSPNDAMADNMEKLRKRYPDGYSDAAAQARADKDSVLAGYDSISESEGGDAV